MRSFDAGELVGSRSAGPPASVDQVSFRQTTSATTRQPTTRAERPRAPDTRPPLHVRSPVMSKTIGLLAGLRTRVPRGPYIAWGLGLAVVKFLVDTAIVYGFSRRVWSPLAYVVPSIALRKDAVGSAPESMHVLLIVLALPFLWIGLSMSV